jgi:hypothetical protein
MGVRLSYFPVALATLVGASRATGKWRACVADFTLGVLLWLVPLVAIAGAKPLVAATSAQAIGHFTRWGGSALTVSSPSLRFQGFAWGLWANVLAGPWADTGAVRFVVGFAIAALFWPLARAAIAERSRASSFLRDHSEIIIGSGLYVAWALLGQNVAYKPRHLLPLLPPLVVALAAGADAWLTRSPWVGRTAAAALAIAWLKEGTDLTRAHREPSPAAALVRHLAESPSNGVVITRELARMIEVGAPGTRLFVADDDSSIVAAAALASSSGPVAFSSEALSVAARRDLEANGFRLEVAFSHPRSRYVDALWSDIALVTLK